MGFVTWGLSITKGFQLMGRRSLEISIRMSDKSEVSEY